MKKNKKIRKDYYDAEWHHERNTMTPERAKEIARKTGEILRAHRKASGLNKEEKLS